MKLVNLTKTMENELSIRQPVTENRGGYLKYTRNYYLLENEEGKKITDERITLIHLLAVTNKEEYDAFTLDDGEAQKALKKQTKPKTQKKATPKPAPEKEKAPAKEAPKEADKKSDDKTDDADE